MLIIAINLNQNFKKNQNMKKVEKTGAKVLISAF